MQTTHKQILENHRAAHAEALQRFYAAEQRTDDLLWLTVMATCAWLGVLVLWLVVP